MEIKIFDIIDMIRKQNDIKCGTLAKAAWGSQSTQSRISELKQVSELNKLGKDEKKVGRLFSFSKFLSLMNGLKNILGYKTLIKELISVYP